MTILIFLRLVTTDTKNANMSSMLAGMCKWTGCDTRCDDVQDFIKHIQVFFFAP